MMRPVTIQARHPVAGESIQKCGLPDTLIHHTSQAIKH